MYKKILLFGIVIFSFLSLNACACQILGACFDKPAQSNHLWQAFRLRGKINNDGWGVAFFPDDAVQLFKEPTDASKSKLAKFLETYPFMESKIFIAHVRKASVGSRQFQNTHPFVRYYSGRPYVLVHNGTLRNFRSRLKLGAYKPIGINDSEYLLCYLLGKISDKKIRKWTAKDFVWLEHLLRETNDVGSINCILSDGKHLFCYHDKNGYNTLFCIHRHNPDKSVIFVDLHQRVNLSKIYDVTDMFVVSTRPLTNEKWQAVAPGQLIVAEDGKIVFGTCISK